MTIEANLKVVDFLDVTLDLKSGIHKPFMKPNNTPLYVNRESNHPPSIVKNIPESINRRLSSISSNKAVFDEAAPPYQEALRKSGYEHKLEYKPPPNTHDNENRTNKRTRTRNITWFNPPYSANVKTNIGKKFLKLVDKCFTPNHKLHKLINRNTVKVSYSCMPNMKQVIAKHNSKIRQSPNQQENERSCNCRNTSTCPLDGKCLTQNSIYQATVKRQDNNKEETYIGLTEKTFKIRYTGHKSTFNVKKQRASTTLSQYIWKLKDENIPYSLKWKIIAKSKAYSPTNKTCNLCTKEKFYILFKPEMSTLNNRNELATECVHRWKHLLYYSGIKQKRKKRITGQPPD